MAPKRFLLTWWNALTSPTYYGELRTQAWHFIFRFVLLSYLVFSIVVAAQLRLRDLPRARGVVIATAATLERDFPTDLKIDWTGKDVTVSQDGPFEIPYPIGWQPDESLPETFAYIAPRLQTAEDFVQLSKSSFFVATTTALYVMQPQGGWRAIPWSELLDGTAPFVIDRASLPRLVAQAQSMAMMALDWAQWLIPAGFLLITPLSRFVTACFDALLMFFILRWLGRPLQFSRLMQIFTYLFVVAEGVQLFGAMVFSQTSLPLFALTFWMYFGTIIWTHWSDKAFWDTTPA